MSEARRAETAAALRWLGAPVTVLCLALLALNDHVLKFAWPGLVTGKLSDVTGLVVAPPLLAVALAAIRVPRPHVAALAATGVGFALTKSTEAGAQVASAIWSVGFPSYIRHDLTDLLALPGLLVAERVRRSARSLGTSARARAGLAVGAAVLPFAVLATTATSCQGNEGLTTVEVLSGAFYDAPGGAAARLVADLRYGPPRCVAVGPAPGEAQGLAPIDEIRIPVNVGGVRATRPATP